MHTPGRCPYARSPHAPRHTCDRLGAPVAGQLGRGRQQGRGRVSQVLTTHQPGSYPDSGLRTGNYMTERTACPHAGVRGTYTGRAAGKYLTEARPSACVLRTSPTSEGSHPRCGAHPWPMADPKTARYCQLGHMGGKSLSHRDCSDSCSHGTQRKPSGQGRRIAEPTITTLRRHTAFTGNYMTPKIDDSSMAHSSALSRDR